MVFLRLCILTVMDSFSFRLLVNVGGRNKDSLSFFCFKDQLSSQQVCIEHFTEHFLGLINVLIIIKLIRIITTKSTDYYTNAKH